MPESLSSQSELHPCVSILLIRWSEKSLENSQGQKAATFLPLPIHCQIQLSYFVSTRRGTKNGAMDHWQVLIPGHCAWGHFDQECGKVPVQVNHISRRGCAFSELLIYKLSP